MRGFILLVALLATADDPVAGKLVGYWFGENFQPSIHGYLQALVQHHPDGTFEAEFRRYEACKLVIRDREAGSWAIVNGTVHQVTRSIEGRAVDPDRDPSLTDDYEVLTLDERVYENRHIASGAIFKLRRVDASFTFPKCDLSS
jgi:hypothetical protein